MLIAYLDEFGHVGPFVSRENKRYNTHPVFGYAGYVIPAQNARYFSYEFNKTKRSLYKTDIEASKMPGQWEKKGAEFFSSRSMKDRPELSRSFVGLVNILKANNGYLFYYGDEKPRGTLKQTQRTAEDYTVTALRETINRLCRHADRQGQDIAILMDDFTEKSRRELVATMYGHIYARTSYQEEMLRIVEPPLHVDSKLNSSVQFADWVCGLVGRATDFQLVENSQFDWAPAKFQNALTGSFTYESKVHLLGKGKELHHSEILDPNRPHLPPVIKNSIGEADPRLRGFYASLRADKD